MTIEEKYILKNKILRGLEKSYQNLIAAKKRNNEELIILKDNQIVRVKPQTKK